MPTYDQYRRMFAGCAMPFAYVDLDLLHANIAAIAERANGTPVRVASKSIRALPLLKRILDADPIFQGVMCFTAPEAVWLAENGLDDLLIGYPTWHQPHVEAICAQVRQGRTITLMVDSVEHVRHLDAIAATQNVTLRLCMDVDMSVDFPGLHFGVWRSSVFNEHDAVRLYDVIAACDHVTLDGVMGYEAQIAGVGEQTPGSAIKNRAIRIMKQRSIPQIAERRAQVVDLLKERGASLRFVNGGGTGSIESTIAEPAVTEVTAGSGFFSPGLFDNYAAFQHHPAAGFAVEIVRMPKPGIFTCLGGGYIASGGTGPDKQPTVHLPQGATLTDLEGAGEVQTPVCYKGRESLKLGDPVFMRHAKAGELCERFNTLLLVKGGEIVDETATYRGEGKAFL